MKDSQRIEWLLEESGSGVWTVCNFSFSPPLQKMTEMCCCVQLQKVAAETHHCSTACWEGRETDDTEEETMAVLMAAAAGDEQSSGQQKYLNMSNNNIWSNNIFLSSKSFCSNAQKDESPDINLQRFRVFVCSAGKLSFPPAGLSIKSMFNKTKNLFHTSE